MYTVLAKEDIQINETAYRFQGEDHGDVPASFFWVFTPPGRGSGLHWHPYQEVFVLQQGQATFTVGEDTIEAQGGTIVIAPPNTPHKYLNSGDTPLQMLSIHPSKQIIQEWLED
jgi:oxalate decarboxylase/phosphoglucose isomerase-like protein (cupin superfamily)